jgi:hypothetical protein
MQISLPTGFSVPVVLWYETDEGVARLVRVWTRWSWVVTSAIDASNGVRALVERVFTPCSSAVVAQGWWLRTRIWRIVGTYLDGRNGVGKIPP